jgi:protoporphyrinogen oxidase
MLVRTLVLGGGLTGITLAHLLRQRGQEATVLEAAERIGGLCRSRSENGFTFDVGGSHIIFSRDHEVLEFMKNVLGSNREQRTRNTRILFRDILVKYPFENGLAALPKDDLFYCINEFIQTYLKAEKGEIPPPANFREWIYATFGKGIADLYMVPYNEKIWNYPPESMSAHWVEGRVPRPPVEDVIKSAIGIETEGYTHQSVFTYPAEGGIESLVKSIARGIEDCILTGFTVRSLAFRGGVWEAGDGKRTVTGDRVISTIPLQHLLPCLGGGVPPAVKEAVGALRYNSVCCVQIGIKGRVPDISWLYIPYRTQSLANRISFPSNFSSHVAPPGHAGILAEITYNEGDEVSRMTDDELVSHVIGSLERMGFLTPGQVVHTAVDRQKFAYVVYDLDYPGNIRIIREYFQERGITLVGRFSQFEYLNMDGCIRQAMECARSWP